MLGECSRKCHSAHVTFRCISIGRGRRVIRAVCWLEIDVEALVGGVFFVVEGADVCGDERFDAVAEAAGCFGEGHAGA